MKTIQAYDCRFSIIIPTHNRPDALTICLEAIAKQEYDGREFEVIIVDDGSLVPPYAVAINRSKKLSLRLLCQTNRGPGSARNTGAKAARGTHLVFIDDDWTPPPPMV